MILFITTLINYYFNKKEKKKEHPEFLHKTPYSIPATSNESYVNNFQIFLPDPYNFPKGQ